MPLLEINIEGYRSLRAVRLALAPLTVVQGANGTGKSNLYSALRIVAAAARGELAQALAAEGGMPSLLWAGPQRRTTRGRKPVRAVFDVSLEDYAYRLELGLPTPSTSLFAYDPEVKTETVWVGAARRPSAVVLTRDAGFLRCIGEGGEAIEIGAGLLSSESALAQIIEPKRLPELAELRAQFSRWRFYHSFRSDSSAAARLPRFGTRTPVLDDAGDGLAAAIQTIFEIGAREEFEAAIDAAFPGAHAHVLANDGYFELQWVAPGMLRPLRARELSDGTLRFLCLLTALSSPRPPALLVLNEPETSLHPELLPPLARAIVSAAARSQLLCTTHSNALVEAMCAAGDAAVHTLRLVDGESQLAGVQPWYDRY